MGKGRAARSLDGLIREIVKCAQPRSAKTFLQDDAEKSFRFLARLDYAAALDKHFDRRQLGEIFTEMRTVLPKLNREVFAILDRRRLARIATAMGAVLHANAFEGCEGRTLRGFYVHDNEVMNRPLICVNTANHPVAVAATFWHEIGHHLTNRIFDASHDHSELSFNTKYEDHLIDPREIAADMLMVLACYPQVAARRLFGDSSLNVREKSGDALISRVKPYVRSVTGFVFDRHLPATENLNYLAGIIHVAKLRSALLNEYGI
ncbi:MAG: hypothetical protein ACYDC3_17285 [Candidatus Binataceae bacterium]